ncbi:unnamed protein product [Spirodela intermedia]|uniref:Uncharacterized protein n=1 Tax=Spirodela intermedia TaxID=51605 RepID=A0A7I8JCZ2_SPIIN|nr:unnamed protein product [Spirodela intermedia]CAA6668020.1 unnamed protein product [Spirodela intermedia]
MIYIWDIYLFICAHLLTSLSPSLSYFMAERTNWGLGGGR